MKAAVAAADVDGYSQLLIADITMPKPSTAPRSKAPFFIAKPARHTTEKVADVAYPVPPEIRDAVKQGAVNQYRVMAYSLAVIAATDADFSADMADKSRRDQFCQMAKMIESCLENVVVQSAIMETAFERITDGIRKQGLNIKTELSQPTNPHIVPKLSVFEAEQLSRIQSAN